MAEPSERPGGRWQGPPRTDATERLRRSLLEKGLPAAPEVLPTLLDTLVGDPDIRGVVRIVERDEGVAARVLSLANSPFFGARRQVTSLSQAVTLIGFTNLRDVAMGFCLWQRFSGSGAAFRLHRRRLWVHAATVAAAARYLAGLTKQDASLAFSAGLLHDIGKLVLGFRLEDRYWSVLEDAARHGQSVAAIEREVFTCDHATVGAWLLQKWQLPTALVDAVGLHHDELDGTLAVDLPSIVATANKLVNATDPRSGTVEDAVLEQICTSIPGLAGMRQWQDAYAEIGNGASTVANVFDA
jgi:putative nucleotidyltransferase with HDIG domain